MKLSEATYFPDATELTRHGFVSHMEDFVGKLIGDNPLKADVDDYLKGFDIDAPKALELLTKPEIEGFPESAVVIKTERIKNGGYDEDGKPMKDEFQVIYKVPKKNPELGIKGIDEKLRNMYIKLFENHVIKDTILEDGEGGMCGDGEAFTPGATADSEDGNGQYTANAFPIVRRKFNENKKMKRPIGRLTMYITEDQMNELAKLIKEDEFGGGALTTSNVGVDGPKDWTYDVPFGAKSKNDPAMDHKNILSRKSEANQPVGHKSLEENSGIHINPENKGKFTATKKRTGKSTSELLHSPNKKTRARANFARMAKRGWKPLEESFDGGYTIETPSKWKHLKDKSVYNHNYYFNPITGEIILEECDDDNYFEFFLVDKNLNKMNRIGEYYYDDYNGPGLWIWDSDKDVTLD